MQTKDAIRLGRKVKVMCMGGGDLPPFTRIYANMYSKDTHGITSQALDTFTHNGKTYVFAGCEHFNGQIWDVFGREIKTDYLN